MNRRKSGAQSFGHAIIDSLHVILQRCDEAGARLGYPGEGGERRFRGWLVTDFIVGLLGWPNERTVVGERFDILLQDGDSFPVVTIETKNPYRKATKREREDFETRLSGFGTLRTAYFTNGVEWERLDIFAPTGVLEIHERFELDLATAGPEEVEAFFTPLLTDRYFGGTPRTTRHAVAQENPHILRALAADLHQAIEDLTSVFRSLFAGLREGHAGEHSQAVTVALFNLWCEKSLTVGPRQAAEQLAGRFKNEALTGFTPRPPTC